jgi:hypothetical protein
MIGLRSSLMTLAILAVATPAFAQSPPPTPVPELMPGQSAPVALAPTLSEIDALKLTVALKDVQIATQLSQIADLLSERARASVEGLIEALEVPGWRLDIQTMRFVKLPNEPPKLPDGTGGK